MTVLAYRPDQITAFWSGVTGIAAVVTGFIAILTLSALRRDSRDRTRPVITAELLPMPLTPGTFQLRIANTGASVAKNVSITFDPPITEDMGVIAGFLARRYAKEIPTLGPSLRLRNIYAHMVGDGSDKTDEPIPAVVTVTARYQDPHGRSYTDSHELTIHSMLNATTTAPSDKNDFDDRFKRLVKAVEMLAQANGGAN